ncbi:hypothetical protein MP638_005922 [Amoeboaphelidium occidentale]|nr:hypothetical protein MP638_005922 [Amoeboaphelidium occidentale]
MQNILKLPTELIHMIAYKLEWEDLLRFNEAVSISGAIGGTGGLLTSAGFYPSYFRDRYPGKVIIKMREYQQDIVDYDNAIRLAYRSKEEFCAYFCRETLKFRGIGKYCQRTTAMPWAHDTAALFHELFLCWINGEDDTVSIEKIDKKLLGRYNGYADGFLSDIFYELMLMRIQSTADQRGIFRKYFSPSSSYNGLKGFHACYNKFFRSFLERLICHPYSICRPSFSAEKQKFPGWDLIASVLPFIDDYSEFCRAKDSGAYTMILDCDIKLKQVDLLLHFIVDGKKKGWEEFLATIIAGNLLRIHHPVGAFILHEREEGIYGYFKKWRPLISDEMLKKKLPAEKIVMLSLESEKLKGFLFGDNWELNESFFRVVVDRYIIQYKDDKYAKIQGLLTNNNTTVEPMKECIQYFARNKPRINSCFALNWAIRYDLTETLSERDVLNDYFEYKLNFKGKNAKAVKEYLATRAANEGFEYLPKSLLKPGYRPQDDSTIRADLERCTPERENMRSYLEKMINSYKN